MSKYEIVDVPSYQHKTMIFDIDGRPTGEFLINSRKCIIPIKEGQPKPSYLPDNVETER